MTEGKIVSWVKSEGDKLSKGAQPVGFPWLFCLWLVDWIGLDWMGRCARGEEQCDIGFDWVLEWMLCVGKKNVLVGFGFLSLAGF